MAAAGAEGWVDEGQVALGDGAVVAEAEAGSVASEAVAAEGTAVVAEAAAVKADEVPAGAGGVA